MAAARSGWPQPPGPARPRPSRAAELLTRRPGRVLRVQGAIRGNRGDYAGATVVDDPRLRHDRRAQPPRQPRPHRLPLPRTLIDEVDEHEHRAAALACPALSRVGRPERVRRLDGDRALVEPGRALRCYFCGGCCVRAAGCFGRVGGRELGERGAVSEGRSAAVRSGRWFSVRQPRCLRVVRRQRSDADAEEQVAVRLQLGRRDVLNRSVRFDLRLPRADAVLLDVQRHRARRRCGVVESDAHP